MESSVKKKGEIKHEHTQAFSLAHIMSPVTGFTERFRYQQLLRLLLHHPTARSRPGCFNCLHSMLPSEPAVTHLNQLMSALMRLICLLCYVRPLKIKMFVHLKMKETEMKTI